MENDRGFSHQYLQKALHYYLHLLLAYTQLQLLSYFRQLFWLARCVLIGQSHLLELLTQSKNTSQHKTHLSKYPAGCMQFYNNLEKQEAVVSLRIFMSFQSIKTFNLFMSGWHSSRIIYVAVWKSNTMMSLWCGKWISYPYSCSAGTSSKLVEFGISRYGRGIIFL